MNTFNVQPHPRVLFEDLPEDLATDELLRLVPSFKLVTHDDVVHEAEYDVLVTFSVHVDKRSSHLHVLSFGAFGAGKMVGEPNSARLDLSRSKVTLAHEMSIPNHVDPAVSRLLRSSVIPHIQEGRKQGWQLRRPGISQSWSIVAAGGDLKERCSPLLHIGAEEAVYALVMRRGERSNGGLSMLLPPETQQHADWLRIFLDMVSAIDPASVPPDLEWTTSEQWSPPDVTELMDDLKTLRDAHERAIAEYQDRERALTIQLEEASSRADSGPRRLLTADGDELTAAALEALQDLGFDVRDMDDHHDEKTGAKLEDLRVEDPSDRDWHCLAEVKGYTKGAKVNDVPQITGRPVAGYTKETGDFPSAVWHIVNPWRKTAPSSRPVAIPDEDDLKPLTDAGGALIDTRDLFEAWRDVSAQKIDAEVVRASLRSAMTRWTYPPT